MYAQLVRSRTTDQTCAEVHRIVADELIPALHDQLGFAGALSLVNAPTGETIMIVLWHSAEQAQIPSPPTARTFSLRSCASPAPHLAITSQPPSGKSPFVSDRATACSRVKTGGSPRCDSASAAPMIGGHRDRLAVKDTARRRRP